MTSLTFYQLFLYNWLFTSPISLCKFETLFSPHTLENLNSDHPKRSPVGTNWKRKSALALYPNTTDSSLTNPSLVSLFHFSKTTTKLFVKNFKVLPPIIEPKMMKLSKYSSSTSLGLMNASSPSPLPENFSQYDLSNLGHYCLLGRRPQRESDKVCFEPHQVP